jgi:cell division transport system permease protein
MENTDVAGDLGELPADVFPASLEVTLVGGIPVQRLSDIAARVERFGAVDEVESYGGWFSRLESLITAGRGIALALCLLVVVCVIAVVGNTIRLAVAGRRDEIEVMKLCGATDGFVRRPFVVEGAAQGFAAALFSLVLLLLGYLVLRSQVNDTVAALSGVSAVFLHPGIMAALLLGGAAVGALGSALSLRRYLTV